MAIQTQHLAGFAVGLGSAALGFYLYKQNQSQVDAFLRKHGIDMPTGTLTDIATLSLEQLVAEKERLEDLIAEREHAASEASKLATDPEMPKTENATRRRKSPARKTPPAQA